MPNNTNNSGLNLIREEARPLSVNELTGEQHKAGIQALSISNALQDVNLQHQFKDKQNNNKKIALSGVVQFEELRYCNVILVDGARGSGKTALLLTLLKAWRDSEVAESVSETVSDTQRADIWKDLVEKRSKFPLPITDLRLMSPAASMILHIAQLMRDVIASKDKVTDTGEVASWSLVRQSGSGISQSWPAFVRAATSGWDSNIVERRPELDPETYASELEHGEQSRINIRSSFERFADDLVVDLENYHGIQNPQLIVPIDDADMNPHRVVEMLRLTDILQHPAIVFLIAGDSKLFEAMLQVHYAGEIRSPSKEQYLTQEELENLGTYKHVKSLARRHYEKSIPEEHRCIIDLLSPEDRFNELFSIEPAEQSAARRLYEKLQPTTALQHCLPSNLRPLMAFRARLQQLHSREGYAEALVDLWHMAVDEEQGLSLNELDDLKAVVDLADKDIRTVDGSVPITVEASSLSSMRDDFSSLQMEIKQVLVAKRTPNGFNKRPDIQEKKEATQTKTNEGHSQFGRELLLHTINTKPVMRYRNVDLSARTVAAWRLVSEIANTRLPTIIGSLVDVKYWQPADDLNCTLSWPIPSEWFVESANIERFSRQWLSSLQELGGKTSVPNESGIDHYFRHYLSALMTLAGASNTLKKWTDIAESLVELIEQETYRHWVLNHSLIMLASEYGGTENVRSAAFKALRKAHKSESGYTIHVQALNQTLVASRKNSPFPLSMRENYFSEIFPLE